MTACVKKATCTQRHFECSSERDLMKREESNALIETHSIGEDGFTQQLLQAVLFTSTLTLAFTFTLVHRLGSIVQRDTLLVRRSRLTTVQLNPCLSSHSAPLSHVSHSCAAHSPLRENSLVVSSKHVRSCLLQTYSMQVTVYSVGICIAKLCATRRSSHAEIHTLDGSALLFLIHLHTRCYVLLACLHSGAALHAAVQMRFKLLDSASSACSSLRYAAVAIAISITHCPLRHSSILIVYNVCVCSRTGFLRENTAFVWLLLKLLILSSFSRFFS